MPAKEPFDIERAIPLLRAAVAPFPKAALFELADDGFGSVFHILVACVLSVRTRDEVTLPAARRLFAAAPTPASLAGLPAEGIDRLIADCTFHRPKADTVREIARQTVADYDGVLPADPAVLTGFRGVGPKCAHLAAGIGGGVPVISVDVHVDRITNRWGYVSATTPEKTMAALEKVLPAAYRVEINALLVPFGKHVCTGVRPKCSTCPLRTMCRQVGVTESR